MPNAKPAKRTVKSKKAAKQTTFQSIMSTLTANKLLLFIVSFGVIGAATLVATHALEKPKSPIIVTKIQGCYIYGNSGRNYPTMVSLKGQGLSNLYRPSYYSADYANFVIAIHNTTGKAFVASKDQQYVEFAASKTGTVYARIYLNSYTIPNCK